MTRRHKTTQSGYTILLAVLIIGAISLGMATALINGGADDAKATIVVQAAAQARALSSACSEEALQQIQANSSYTGSGNLSLATGTCAYTVTNTGGTSRLVASTGSSGNSTRRQQISVTVGGTNISVSSWQDVP